MSKKEETIEYFKDKAKDYDLVEHQIYWNLSDELLWHIMKQLVLDDLKHRNIAFMDAGTGTGRWSIKVAQYLNRSIGKLCDISDEMLAEAGKKIVKLGLSDRLVTEKCDIETMPYKNDTFDVIFNFHNVLGFVETPRNVIFEMCRVLKPGGVLVSVVPNLYHALFFNTATRRFHDLDKIVGDGKGRFADNMPFIHMFTPDDMRKAYEEAGLLGVKIFGFPVTIYPGTEETKITGNTKTLEQTLAHEDIYKLIISVEKKLILREEAASRGNNLFAIGVKK